MAQAVVDANCDSAVLMSYATDGAAIVEALKAQGFSGGIFGGDGIGDAGFIDEFTDASAVTGVVATNQQVKIHQQNQF